jgi:hypothetical protein
MINRAINKMLLLPCNAFSRVMTQNKQGAFLPCNARDIIGVCIKRWLMRFVTMVVVLAPSPQVFAESPIAPNATLRWCREGGTYGCDSGAFFTRAATSPWRLVRAKADKDGEAYVSIMKTADTLNSDPDFAGLMLRCGAKGKINVLVVLVRPLPPKSKPPVTIGAGPQGTTRFEGRMEAAGAAVLLPDVAGSLAGGPWQRLPTLAISVGEGADTTKGVVALDGLGAAYSNLVGSCGM